MKQIILDLKAILQDKKERKEFLTSMSLVVIALMGLYFVSVIFG